VFPISIWRAWCFVWWVWALKSPSWRWDCLKAMRCCDVRRYGAEHALKRVSSKSRIDFRGVVQWHYVSVVSFNPKYVRTTPCFAEKTRPCFASLVFLAKHL